MLLPSKSVPNDQALLAVGAQILIQLERPGSVSAVWERLMAWRAGRELGSSLPFWWYALALDVLYTIGVIELREGELRRTNADIARQ